MTCHGCNSDEHLVSQCPQKGKGKGGSQSMVNLWVADQGSGSQLAEASQAPPWMHDDLLFEPPMTSSHGYVQQCDP